MLLLFVIFVVGAVLVGAGAMLAPAWRTAQPRIALSATLGLALITGGSVWWAYAFGWDTLVVDYLLFALVSIVVLGGTFAQGQARAEARGETLEDKDQGWPGPGDLLFLAGVGGIITVLVNTLTLPLGTVGQQIGYVTVLARHSSQFDTFAPHAPELAAFYAPGFVALTSYLSKQLLQTVAAVQFGVSGVVAFLLVWLCYDWGSELGGRRMGRAFGVAALLSGGALLMLLTGQYTLLLGTLFALGAGIGALRLQRDPSQQDAVATGLLVGAAIYADFVIGLAALVGLGAYVGWCLVRRRCWMPLALMVGALLFGLGPWLVTLPGRTEPLLFHDDSTWFGWLTLPIVYGLGVALHYAAERLPAGAAQRLHKQRYPLLMAGLLMAVLAASGVGLAARAQHPLTEEELAALLWLNDNRPPETVLANRAPDDWSGSVCECLVTQPPLPLPAPARPPEVRLSRSLTEGSVLFQRGEAALIALE
jgi:hypothetical protein